MGAAPTGYVWVSGGWYGGTYVDGFYRPAVRAGWVWVDGSYAGNAWVSGHWRPAQAQAPSGYVWEAGFWDGDGWVEGFWRPQFRQGYAWVAAFADADGVRHNGYWAPLEGRDGYTWVPGWFDGERWIDGYWVEDCAYDAEDVAHWQPPAGRDAGWDVQGYGSGGIVEGDGYGSPSLGISVRVEVR
jgi:hypothetical protein